MNPDQIIAALCKHFNKTQEELAKLEQKLVFDQAVLFRENEPTEGDKKLQKDIQAYKTDFHKVQEDFKASEAAFGEFREYWEEIQTAIEEVSVLAGMGGKDTIGVTDDFNTIVNPLKEKKKTIVANREAYFKSCQEKGNQLKQKINQAQNQILANKLAMEEALAKIGIHNFGDAGAKTRQRRWALGVQRTLNGEKAQAQAQCALNFQLNEKTKAWEYSNLAVMKQETMFKAFDIKAETIKSSDREFVLNLVCSMVMNTMDLTKKDATQDSNSSDISNSKSSSVTTGLMTDTYEYDESESESYRRDLNARIEKYKSSKSNWALSLGFSFNAKADLSADLKAELGAKIDLAVEGVDSILKIISILKNGTQEQEPKQDPKETKKETPVWLEWAKKVLAAVDTAYSIWSKIPRWIVAIAKKIPVFGIGAIVRVIDTVFTVYGKAKAVFDKAVDIYHKFMELWNLLTGADSPKKSNTPQTASGNIGIKFALAVEVAISLNIQVAIEGNAKATLSWNSSSESKELTKINVQDDIEKNREKNIDSQRIVQNNSQTNSHSHSERHQKSHAEQHEFGSDEKDIDASTSFTLQLLCKTDDQGKLVIVQENASGSDLAALEKNGLAHGSYLSYKFKADIEKLFVNA